MAFPQERQAAWNAWVKRRAIEKQVEKEEDARPMRDAAAEEAAEFEDAIPRASLARGAKRRAANLTR